MFIVNPDIGDDEREKLISRLKNTISKNKGDIIRLDDMGIKSLTYKIQKKFRGHYLPRLSGRARRHGVGGREIFASSMKIS
ncbi:MAG: 30S ribosomal protein S6 [Rhodopseudomonas palustris]|nr:30S ribosomal protein S6 [Rhodopseudomonas palustris]